MADDLKRRPDYILKVLDTETDYSGRIGCGWLKASGAIVIAVNPACVIDGNVRGLIYTLFPNDYDPEIAKTYRETGRKRRRRADPAGPEKPPVDGTAGK